MTRQLTCPVCGFHPVAVLTEREELNLLGQSEITRDGELRASEKPPSEGGTWARVDCPNRGGEHGSHGFYFNKQTWEVSRERPGAE